VAAGEIRNEGPPAQRAAVEHWVSWEWSDESGPVPKISTGRAAALEARALAKDLAELHREHGVPWQEMGILFRGMGDLDVYLSALRESGIPYDVARERTYYQRREIVEASAWLQTVLDPLDGLSLVTTLRSAAVGVPDAALVALWDARIFERLAALREPDEHAFAELDAEIERVRLALPAGVPGLDRVAGWDGCLRAFVRVLAELRRSHASEPLDVFIEKLRALSLLEVGEASRFLGAYSLANLDRLFRELEAELERGGDAQALLRRLRTGISQAEEAESARPTEAADDAVRVMTIHKAKGLDFEHTYVVQLHKRPGGAGQDPDTVPFERLDERDEYVLFGAPTLGRHAVQARDRRVEAAERVRTLYVAATRAKRRLVLMGTWPENAPDEPLGPEHAKSYVDLLASRAGGRPDLIAQMTAAHDAGVLHHDGHDGVRWVFPGLLPAEAASPSAGAGADLGSDGAGVRARALALGARRRRAQEVMGLPYRATASDDGHAGEREEQAEKRFRDAAGPAPSLEGIEREAARVAGTVVHRVLEELDLEAEPAAALADQRARLAKRLAGLSGEAAAREAAAKANRVLDALEASGEAGLLGRLRELREHIVARELDVLLAPSADEAGPVGFVSGAIDLVYRDPADARLVVVDYKTDAIANEAQVDERAQRYEGQGRAYQRALREALDLSYTPRFELWFLSAGIVRTV
jgi:ATP-dependent exoDNAse (exonuclease V) beta subunit